MLGRTIHEHIFILISIALLRLVAPASFLYLFLCLYTRSLAINHLAHPWIFPIALLEVSFYLLVYIPRKGVLQKATYTAPLLTPEQRHALFLRCSQHISFSSTSSAPSALTSTYPLGWFSSPVLKRENLIEWILWALFSCDPSNPHVEDSWKDEINAYVARVEEILGRKVEAGKEIKTKALRLTLDEVKMVHRPLVWYMIVALVDFITSVKLYSLGFRQYAPSNQLPLRLRNIISPGIFPPRFFGVFAQPSLSATEYFSYWYRPHRTSDRDPIVFIHGIGIGLHPYTAFIQDLVRLDPNQGILLVELLPISMHICSSSTSDPPTPAMPPRRDMLDALYRTMHSLGMSHAVLAAHSYGTVIAAHVIRDRDGGQGRDEREQEKDGLDGNVDKDRDPDRDTLRHRNKATNIHPSASQPPANELHPPKPTFTSHLLIDPIPFLLHLPDVAFNFLYRVPKRANEWQLWYFASRDPDIAFTLGRCFFWTENILWKEDLDEKIKFAVVLSGKDQIVPAPLVRRYLTGEDEVKHLWSSSSASNSVTDKPAIDLEVIYNPDLDHAMVFDTKERRKDMVDVLDRFTRREHGLRD
ncbi:hypothetical protein F5880DRAFT_498512 [Lentinula raphanica]|nr:hypothetical protein F5880DRAFT_498512 [Lentinula raphanica]